MWHGLYLLLGAAPIQRCFSDDLCCEHLFVLHVGYLVAFCEASPSEDLAPVVLLDYDFAIYLSDLFFDDSGLIGRLLIVPTSQHPLLRLAVALFHSFIQNII